MAVKCTYKGRTNRYIRCVQVHSTINNKLRFRGLFGVHADEPVRRTQAEIDAHFKATKMLLPAYSIGLPEQEIIIDFDHVEGADIFKEAYEAMKAYAAVDMTDVEEC